MSRQVLAETDIRLWFNPIPECAQPLLTDCQRNPLKVGKAVGATSEKQPAPFGRRRAVVFRYGSISHRDFF
jgi:hypothetical protein